MKPSIDRAPARPSDCAFLVGCFVAGLLRRYLRRRSGSLAGEHTARILTARPRWPGYGFYLEEVSHAAGIDFVHQAPTLDPKLATIMPEVASMGASVSIVDFDRDGWPDIYVTNSADRQQEPPLPQHARRHI